MVLALCEMKTSLPRLLTRVTMSIFSNDDHYFTNAAKSCEKVVWASSRVVRSNAGKWGQFQLKWHLIHLSHMRCGLQGYTSPEESNALPRVLLANRGDGRLPQISGSHYVCISSYTKHWLFIIIICIIISIIPRIFSTANIGRTY